MSLCRICLQIEQRKAPDAPLWNNILDAQYYDVAHAANSALPGWTMIVAKRHVSTLDELTEDEAIELGLLIRRVSQALKQAVGCVNTYVMQFSEKQPHVHFHIVPRMAELEEQSRGPKVFNYMDVEPDQSVPIDVRNEIAEKMREMLLVNR